ncbi:MAG: hypothetical protein AB1831_14435 [Pseudomonadota bacterium]
MNAAVRPTELEKTLRLKMPLPWKLLSLSLLALGVAGCATSRSVRQADGWLTHVVGCGGPFLNMGHCVEKAGEVCGGRGYTVLNAVGGELPKPNAMPTGGLPDIPNAAADLKAAPERKLLIKCN